MHLYPPDSLDPDDIEGWRRHPLTKWLAQRLSEEEKSLIWYRIGPDGIHHLWNFQGRREVIDAILRLAKGDEK